MDNIVATTFTQRFLIAYDRSDINTYRELARRADISPPIPGLIANGHFDDSKSGPGIFNVKRMADALNTSVGFLLGDDIASKKAEQNILNGTDRPRGVLENLMEIHWRGAGMIEAFGDAIEDCDVYAVPTEEATRPLITRVGKRTLVAKRLGGPFVKDAQREFEKMSIEKCEDILNFHRRVVKEETAIGNSFLDHKMVTRAAHVRASNARLGLLVNDESGNQSILLHAMPIPV